MNWGQLWKERAEKAEKERDELKAQLRAWRGFEVAASEHKSVSEVLSARLVAVEKERDAEKQIRYRWQQDCERAEAACAEMRAAVTVAVEYVEDNLPWDEEGVFQLQQKLRTALSSAAGKGWVNPDEHERLVGIVVTQTRESCVFSSNCEISRLDGDLILEKEENEKLLAENEKLRERISGLDNAVLSQMKIADSYVDENEKLRAAVDVIRDRSKVLSNECEKLRREIQERADASIEQLSNYNRELEKLRADLEKAKANETASYDRAVKLSIANENLEKKNAFLGCSIDNLRAKLSVTTNELLTKTKLVDELRAELKEFNLSYDVVATLFPLLAAFSKTKLKELRREKRRYR